MPVTSQAEKAVAQAEKKYSQVNGWYKLLTVTRLKIINEQLLKLNIEQIL
jgi:hypothetical protein